MRKSYITKIRVGYMVDSRFVFPTLKEAKDWVKLSKPISFKKKK